MTGHEAYPAHLGPAFQSPLIIWSMLSLIILLGTGLAVIIWFGIFSAIGGAYFQMWQTEAGAQALEGSFWYSMQNGLVWLMIRARD